MLMGMKPTKDLVNILESKKFKGMLQMYKKELKSSKIFLAPKLSKKDCTNLVL